MMLLSVAPLLWAVVAQQPLDCVPIVSTERLNAGTNFSRPLPRGLEFRLIAEGPYGWRITVGPPDGMQDFIWVVSPPFQTAPQLQFGPVYGLTATQSAKFDRLLRFVITAEDYKRALELYEQWRQGESAEETGARRNQLATGALELRITKFSVRPRVKVTGAIEVEAFKWIEFKGRACVPRGGG